jgi:hypothetical protein
VDNDIAVRSALPRSGDPDAYGSDAGAEADAAGGRNESAGSDDNTAEHNDDGRGDAVYDDRHSCTVHDNNDGRGSGDVIVIQRDVQQFNVQCFHDLIWRHDTFIVVVITFDGDQAGRHPAAACRGAGR